MRYSIGNINIYIYTCNKKNMTVHIYIYTHVYIFVKAKLVSMTRSFIFHTQNKSFNYIVISLVQ